MFNNLAIFYVLKLILSHQEYRIAYIYTTSLTKDFSSRISELAWKHMIPVTLIDFDKIQNRKNRCEEPILNVFVMNNLSDASMITRKNLLPNDVTVFLFTSVNITVDDVKFQTWIKLRFKVLIICNEFLISLNKFHVEEFERIMIRPNDTTATQLFVKKNLLDNQMAHGAKMTIFMQHNPPKSLVAPLFSNYSYYSTFNGPDGTISDILFKCLNVTPTYVTDVAFLFPTYLKWRQQPILASRSSYYLYHKRATAPANIISKFDATANSSIDFLMVRTFLNPDLINGTNNRGADNLYPHRKECVAFFVPRQLEIENFLRKTSHHGDVQSILIVLLLFVLARIIIQKATWNNWPSITFNTLQLFFVQGKIMNRNAVEEAWSNILRGFSFFAITTISAILYNSLVNVKHNELDTVADLIASNLTIVVSEALASHFQDHDDSKTETELLKRIVFEKGDEYGQLLGTNKFNFAYATYETNAQFLLKVIQFHSLGGPDGHIMKEKLHCRLSSYQISKSLPFKRVANDVLQRCLESGLYDKALEWSRALIAALYKKYKIETKEENISVKLTTIFIVFIWYSVGILIGFVVFMTEILLCCSKRSVNSILRHHISRHV